VNNEKYVRRYDEVASVWRRKKVKIARIKQGRKRNFNWCACHWFVKNKNKSKQPIFLKKKLTPSSYCEHKKKNNAKMEEHTWKKIN